MRYVQAGLLLSAAAAVAACLYCAPRTAHPPRARAAADVRSSTPPATTASAAPSHPPRDQTAPLDAPATRASVVVWTRPDPNKPAATADNAPNSYFLDNGGREIAHAPGIYVASEDRLYHLTSETHRGPKLYCPDGQPNAVYPERSLERLVLRSDDEATSIELAGFASGPPEDLPHKETHELMASLGPYLFMRTSSESACGAHPMYGASFRAVEVREGRLVDLPAADLFAGEDELRTAATREFNRIARSGSTGSLFDDEVQNSDLEPTLAIPSFTADGLRWSIQLTTGASWGGSYGGWGGYSRSVILQAPSVPDRFRAFSELGERVARYLSANPRARVLGASSGDFNPPTSATPK